MNDLTFNLVLLEKDSRPANATMYASMFLGKNADWGEGDKTCTLENGAVWNEGKIDIIGLNKAARYNAVSKFTTGQKGGVRWWIRPGYNGSAPTGAHQSLIDINNGTGNADYSRIAILHGEGSGTVALYMYDTAGSVINVVNLPIWQASQNLDTELEIGWDLTTSPTKTALFIGGNRHGNLLTGGSGLTRDIGNQIRFGNHYNGTTTANFSLTGVCVFSEMQHEVSYIPGPKPNNTIPKIWGYTTLPTGTDIDMSTLTFESEPQ